MCKYKFLKKSLYWNADWCFSDSHMRRDSKDIVAIHSETNVGMMHSTEGTGEE
jgi:hypothetical protein